MPDQGNPPLRNPWHDPSVRPSLTRTAGRPRDVARSVVLVRSGTRAKAADSGESAMRPNRRVGRRAGPPSPAQAAGLLIEGATLLDSARNAGDLRRAVAFNVGLWRGIGRLADGSRLADTLSAERCQALRDHAAYVVAACEGGVCPDDAHLETFITLARRDSGWLAEAAGPAPQRP